MAERGVMNSRTRLKLTLGATVFLVVTTFVSIARGMEGVATTCVAGVMTILSTYIWAETRRPSRGWRAGGFDSGGYHVSGYQTGGYPSGEYETNDYQTGDYQAGDYHTGNYRADSYQAGGHSFNDYRTGEYHTGDYHTSEYQPGDYHTDNYPDQGQAAEDYPTQETPNHTNSNYNHKQRVKHHQGGRHVQDDYG